MSLTPHFMSRVAYVGLVAVLCFLAGFAMWTGTATRQAATRTQNDSARSALYQQVRYAVSAESADQHVYWASGDTAALRSFHQASRLVTSALAAMAADPADRPFALAESGRQHEYVKASHSLFVAVAAGKRQEALAIDRRSVRPVLLRMERDVDTGTHHQSQRVASSVAYLGQLETFIQLSSGIIFAVGMVLLVLFWGALRIYRRRMDEANDLERLRLQQAALTDSVTGLGNHRAFQETFKYELHRAVRYGQQLSLALIDLDDFKVINDTQGHAHGDRVLLELASVLGTSRSEDRPFRIGGDEFAMILPHVTAMQATAAMERLRVHGEKSLFGATLSIGLAELTADNGDAHTLREEADAALYEAKRRGRNTVMAFDEIKHTASIVSASKINSVRSLIADRGLAIAFQPIWDLDRNVILGYEALARPAPDYGLSGPQEAFDIAEKIGHAAELDDVCRQLILDRAEDLPEDALLFMNLSPQSLDHPRLSGSRLRATVEAAGLTPQRIVLEITERSVSRVDMVVREAVRLRTMGFRLALDDVGVGNAGLEVLRHLPVDFLKIDRSVIAEAVRDNSASAVLAGVIAFARKARTYVIAEGIETPAMLEAVQTAGLPDPAAGQGVHGAQGYLLGRPSTSIAPPTPADGTVLPYIALQQRRAERHA